MRGEIPLSISESDSSTIRFSAFEVGYMAGSFEFASQNFGNDKLFQWIAGGGEKRYRISLVKEGLAFDDSAPITVWDIEIANPNGSIIYYLQLGKKEGELVYPTLIDHATGEEAECRAHSEVMDMALDLQDELQQPGYDLKAISRDGIMYPLPTERES